MTTRRHFLQSIVALPPILSMKDGWAASPDPSRLALVIGNGSYRDAPLVNPVNDARSMAGLLGQAGFTVSSHIDASRLDMMAAIDRFSAEVGKTETRLVMFYYAGHGVQLDWRNYLLPVDAVAQSAEQIRQSCIDVNQLIGQLGRAKGKTFVIMLDACRDNPFGSSYQPEQKGLSQFDAPVGSLLAYATAPGSVASDGNGQNGLYTENLLRELSVRGTQLEDALKRVRLNVRLASGGAQIPWETTSLESDIFIFNDGNKKLSEAELEKQLEADLNTWARIKASRDVKDWVAYLRNFPNGRFAEIAQTRLSRLLAPIERPAQVSAGAAVSAATVASQPATVPPAVDPAGGKQPPVAVASVPSKFATAPAAKIATAMPAIELAAGKPVPPMLQASVNPFSAGRYPLGRKYTVGDTATFRISDLLTGIESDARESTVTSVDLENDRVDINGGEFLLDSMGNYLRTPMGGTSDVPQQFFPAELQVGKAWAAGWKQDNPKFGQEIISFDMRIAAFEKVRVPAGEFEAFRIEARGWARRSNGSVLREQRFWVVPGLNFTIKLEVVFKGFGRLIRTDRTELVSMQQQSMDTRCAAPSGGQAGTWVIRNGCA
jgi:uncharacterized caspase-like protein